MGSTLGSLLAFVGIVALIPLALWLLKRTPIGGGAALGVMRTVAMLPISANQRLLTVEVGSGDERKWLVLACRRRHPHAAPRWRRKRCLRQPRVHIPSATAGQSTCRCQRTTKVDAR
jgi:flagellar biogenesis protein FliO